MEEPRRRKEKEMRKKYKKCSYCNKKAKEVIYVCPDHAKSLDRVATRRKKIPVPVELEIVEPEEEKKES